MIASKTRIESTARHLRRPCHKNKAQKYLKTAFTSVGTRGQVIVRVVVVVLVVVVATYLQLAMVILILILSGKF